MKIIDSFELTHQRHAPALTSFYSLFLSAVYRNGKRINGSFKKGAVVTDVGSVKGKLVRIWKPLCLMAYVS